MIDPQFWPSGTQVKHQTFAGGRLRFIRDRSPDHLGSRLEFEFTRNPCDRTLHEILPPVQFLGPSIQTSIPLTRRPYDILVNHNQFLRSHHPQVDLPKSLLLENLLEDLNLPQETEPFRSSLLTGLTIDEHHDVIISAGGRLGNELYYASLHSDPSNPPKLQLTSKPVVTLRTPVEQLTSGPSLNSTADAVFLARSHDSTILFTYSPPSSSVLDPEDLGCERSTSAKFAFGVGHELKTRDTEHEAHIDACVGHTINETLRQFIVLNAQGQLWRVSGIGDHGSLKRVGKISRITPDRLAWGRCGIYPSNDTLVVGLRDSLIGECSHLYSVPNGQQITDIQRYVNNRSSHLRLITTTSSIVCLDDRKPGTPMLDIKHFRASDLTLSMSFCAEPEWSPRASYSLSAAGERFDKVLLWSRVNDVASFYQFKFNPAIPPSLLGYPDAVSVGSSTPSNRRAGLIFFRRKPLDNHPEKLCLVEMKRDGSLSHQQLGVFAPTDSIPSVYSGGRESIVRYTIEAEAADDSLEKDNWEDEDGFAQPPTTSLKLSTICQDFASTCLPKSRLSSPRPEEISRSTSDPTNPLGFCKLSGLGAAQSNPERNDHHPLSHQSSIADLAVDLNPVFEFLTNDYKSFNRKSSPIYDEIRQTLDVMLKTATNMFMKTRVTNSSYKHRDCEPPSSDCGSDPNLHSSSITVDRLMEGWRLGTPTSEYQWIDLCCTNPNETFESNEAESGYYSERSPKARRGSQNRFEFTQEVRSSESTVDIIKASKPHPPQPRHEPTTPRSVGQTFERSLLAPSSPDLGRSSSDSPNANIPLTSNSQPNPRFSPYHSSLGLIAHQVSSQLIPGAHAARNSTSLNSIKKKKRVGGF